MKKTIIPLIIVLLILVGSLIFFLFQNNFLTGKAIQENYIYTKAICNSTNFCQDYEITCNGENILSTKPITGAVVQHQKDWIDPRKNTENEKVC